MSLRAAGAAGTALKPGLGAQQTSSVTRRRRSRLEVFKVASVRRSLVLVQRGPWISSWSLSGTVFCSMVLRNSTMCEWVSVVFQNRCVFTQKAHLSFSTPVFLVEIQTKRLIRSDQAHRKSSFRGDELVMSSSPPAPGCLLEASC